MIQGETANLIIKLVASSQWMVFADLTFNDIKMLLDLVHYRPLFLSQEFDALLRSVFFSKHGSRNVQSN